MDNRFLRCVAEHREEMRRGCVGSDRLSQFVAAERSPKPLAFECRKWEEFRPALLQETAIYYSPKPTLASPTSPPSASASASTAVIRPKCESFEERYARAQAAKGIFNIPTSPLVVPRKRHDSLLSLASQESFPSLSPASIKPQTPKITGWSDTVRKNLDSMQLPPQAPQERIVENRDEEGEEVEGEEVIEYDEDGFPYVRYQ